MIPVQARLEIIRKKDEGETWTGISRWMEEEYGVTIHRTTIQRWYDKEVCRDVEVGQEELLESLDDRVKIDKKVQTLKTEASYYKKLYTQALKTFNNQEAIVDAIRTYSPTFDPVPVIPPSNNDSMGQHPQTMVAVLTDTHVGERVALNQMAGLNDYDLNKFNRRLSGWASQVLNLATYRRNICDVNELVVPLLGDIISGDIHEELSRSNIDNCMIQMLSAAHVISQALMYLAPHFESVRVPCVVGNHGRMTRKPPMKDKYMDWDYMVYQWIAAFCARQSNITFQIPKTFAQIINICNRKVLLFHGDSISGGGSSQSIHRMVSAMRGVTQFRQAIETTVVKHDGDLSDVFTDVMLGHFHRVDTYDIGTGSAWICGTTKGGDEFSLNRLQAVSAPKQVVTYWHPVYGNVGTEIVYLHRYDDVPSLFSPSVETDVWVKSHA
tara:strand:+ start:4094 stop:5410 length:1317 start_codon:yes stop_codon:yes gene_type:complete